MSEIDCKNLEPTDLPTLQNISAAAHGIKRIFLHWSAGNYGQAYDDYHICIDNDGQIYLMCDDLNQLKSHTWHRNTNSIGMAILGAAGASANNGYDCDLGDQPPTSEQIESMSNAVAIICEALQIPIDYDHVTTHEEIATEDGYGPGSGDPETRWDLWYLEDYDGEMKPGGDVIRGKANWYAQKGF